MFKSNSGLQTVNRILILIFSLMIAYVFTWPAEPNHTSHMLDDRSYVNCHGTLARPVAVNHRIVGGYEYITLPAGTEIIYSFENGKPVFINLYSEQGMNSSVLPHDYTRQELSPDDLVNPEAIEQNLIRITNEKAERETDYEAAKQAYKYMFVPSQLIYAIPVGIILFTLLCLLESMFKRPHIFTIEMGIILPLVGFIVLMNWVALSTPCR